MKRILTIVFFCLMFNTIQAQSPKREMRATWLTTVWRLDWPSVTVPKATGTNEAARQAAILQQKNDLIVILDALKAANMNAAFFQVRSMCDAMYQSSYEPWSAFVSSERGAHPGYDPLAFAIEEAHKRGIELHAWLNPFRYSTSASTHGELSTDYYNTNRNWLLAYDSYLKILNPGLPQVVQQIKRVVGEIVNNYNVDGVVFDDYFYAYGGTSNTLDAEAQALYKPAGKDLGDWRRENVNRMVAAVYDTIQRVKPYVTFGVSPFGTWTTDPSVALKRGIMLPAGVGATGDMYKEIYCDPIAWLEQGTVDYISPQLYWTTYSAYPYGKLAPWWSDISNRFGRHFYSSHSLSSMTASTAPAGVVRLLDEEIPEESLSTLEKTAIARQKASSVTGAPEAVNFLASEIGLQIDFNRSSDVNDAPGSVFYATSKVVKTSGFTSYLGQNKFTHQALCPAIGWKNTMDHTLVDNIALSGQVLTWSYTGTNVRYAIYAVPIANRNDANVFASSKHLIGLSYGKQFTLPAGISQGTHKIAISVVDRYGNEFSVRVMGEALSPGTASQLVLPANNDSQVLLPSVFRWNAIEGADVYTWQLARDALLTDLVCSRETTKAEFYSGLQANLEDNTEYFWRVKTRKINASDTWSEVRRFSGHKFRINSPANGTGNVPLSPVFTWDDVSSTATYTLEISTALDFSATKQVFKQTVQATQLTIPVNMLIASTSYYARVSVLAGTIQATSETIKFTTQDLVISIPQISKPANAATVRGTSIEVCWIQQASKGFRVELSKDPAFPARSTTVKSVDAFTFCTMYENLSSDTYYVRAKALTNDGLTDASPMVTVILDGKTALEPISSDGLSCIVRTNTYGETLLYVNSNVQFQATISLFSITGIKIFQKDYNIIRGENNLLLGMNTIPRGIYTVLIENDKAKVKVPFKILL